jgi:hypothetical protein
MKYFFLFIACCFFVCADAQREDDRLKQSPIPSVFLRKKQPPTTHSFLEDSAYAQKKYNDLMHRSRIFKTAGIPLTAVGGAVFFTGVGFMYYSSFNENLSDNDSGKFRDIGLAIMGASAALLVPGIVLTVKGVGYKKRAKRIQKTLAFAPDVMMDYASGSAYSGKLVLNF